MKNNTVSAIKSLSKDIGLIQDVMNMVRGAGAKGKVSSLQVALKDGRTGILSFVVPPRARVESADKIQKGRTKRAYRRKASKH